MISTTTIRHYLMECIEGQNLAADAAECAHITSAADKASVNILRLEAITPTGVEIVLDNGQKFFISVEEG